MLFVKKEFASTPDKKANGIIKWGHIERKDQGRTAQLVFLFSESSVLKT